MQSKDPIVLQPGEGNMLNVIGRDLFFLANKEQTNGMWSMIEYTAPPNAPGPPPHYHKEMEEAFYVVQGTLTVSINGNISETGAGGFVNIPPYAIHTFENKSDKPLKVLILMSPGGFENYFFEMNELVKANPGFPPKDMKPFIQLYEKYDTWLPEQKNA
jgi:quercetin dioxygenase-like cupin family protein